MPRAFAGPSLRFLASLLPVALVAGGCLKTLDESLIDANKDGGGGSHTGGTGGTGGTKPDGSTGGTGGVGGDASSDGGIIPYDPSKFPPTKITTATPPIILTSDDTDVYFSVDNAMDAQLAHSPIAGGAPTNLITLERPHALATTSTSTYVFAVGGQNSGDGGTLVRTLKNGGAAEPIAVNSASMGPAVTIYAATDGFAYVTFQADGATHTPAVARFGLGAGVSQASVLFSATSAETGGPVVASGNCVYWVSNGNVWTMPSGGGASRTGALTTDVTDAVGLTADAVNIYYTRGEGSVWSRSLSTSCDNTGATEKKLASGFTGLGGIIRFKSAPTIAWAATGNPSANYDGGGIYMMAVSGGTITQIGPKDQGPSAIVDAPFDVVFAVTTGEIRKVPKP